MHFWSGQTMDYTGMLLRESVIDKLLSWQSLTQEEQTLKTKIIQERADRKAQMEKRKAQMEQYRVIMEKKRAWEPLTQEEQTKLGTLKANMKKSWKNWKYNKWFKWERWGCNK